MRTVADILQEHFGPRVSTPLEAGRIFSRTVTGIPPPGTIPSHLSIPYLAADCPAFPHPDEIRRARKENVLNARNGLREVYRVENMVVKIGGAHDILDEAENLIFLAENSQVNVPKVYAVYSQKFNGILGFVLITEFIQGVPLRYDDWMSYTEEERTILCSRIAEQYRLLRSIPSEGYYGRVHRQGFIPSMSMFRTNGQQCCGPYETYEDFASAVIRSAEVTAATTHISLRGSDTLREKDRLLLSEYKLALETSTDQKPFFTHVDPKERNVILRRIPGIDGHPPDWKVTLIDWAGAGWFPAWVQGASFAQMFSIWESAIRPVLDLSKGLNLVDSKDFVARVYGDMECGEELVRISGKVSDHIRQSIY